MEIWKDILGFEGYYQVSESGIVRSLDRIIDHPIKGLTNRNGKILKQFYTSKYGHKNVYLYICGKVRKIFSVHSLVLEAFICKRPKGLVCRHLDGNANNNHYSNLAWGTYQDNSDDSIRHNSLRPKKGESNGNSVHKESDVLFIDSLLKSGKTQKYIYNNYNYPKHFVNDISSGRTWSHLTGRIKKK